MYGECMSHEPHQILLYHPDPDVIDLVFSALDSSAAGLPHIKIVPVLTLTEAVRYSEQNHFTLVISHFNASESNALTKLFQSQYPNFSIAILDVDASRADVKNALVLGADDLYFTDDLTSNNAPFLKGVQRAIERGQLLDAGENSRHVLELRLAQLKEDQQAALQLQQQMLPLRAMNVVADIEVKYTLRPSLYLSGDFVDIAAIDERYCMFYLADVSGHGASSALVTVLLKNLTTRLLRNFKRQSSFDILNPVKTLQRINGELLETGLGKHLTIFLGLIDLESNEMNYAVGGHHPMPIYKNSKDAYYLSGRGMPVGLFESPVFDEHTLTLDKSFSLTLFSDGILEVLPQPTIAEKEQYLLDYCHSHAIVNPDNLVNELTGEAKNGAPDDIAVMILTRHGE